MSRQVCCSVLQFVAVCCSEIRVPMECPARCDSVAGCCRVLNCVAVKLKFPWNVPPGVIQCVAACCSLLQCVAVEFKFPWNVPPGLLQCAAPCCIMMQCVLVCCSVLQFVAVCSSVLLPLCPLLNNQQIYRGL